MTTDTPHDPNNVQNYDLCLRPQVLKHLAPDPLSSPGPRLAGNGTPDEETARERIPLGRFGR